MANGYQRKFTLSNIFNNKQLADKLPIVNYEKKGDGKYRTKMDTLMSLIRGTIKTSANPFYKPLTIFTNGNRIDVGGTLVGDYDIAYETIYSALLAQKAMMRFTANSADMVRSALVESKKTKGKEPRLWLRINTITQIKHMSEQELEGLMDDIMQNIIFNHEYAHTQERFNVQDIKLDKSPNYAHALNKWKHKVGVREWNRYEQN